MEKKTEAGAGVSERTKVVLAMVFAMTLVLVAVGCMVFYQVAPQFESFLATRGKHDTRRLRSSSMVELLYEQKDALQKRLKQAFAEDKELMYVVITKTTRKSDEEAGVKQFEVFAIQSRERDLPMDPGSLISLHLDDPNSMIRGEGFLGFTSEVRTGISEYGEQWGHVLVGYRTSKIQALKAWLLESLIKILGIALAGFALFVHLYFKRRAI